MLIWKAIKVWTKWRSPFLQISSHFVKKLTSFKILHKITEILIDNHTALPSNKVPADASNSMTSNSMCRFAPGMERTASRKKPTHSLPSSLSHNKIYSSMEVLASHYSLHMGSWHRQIPAPSASAGSSILNRLIDVCLWLAPAAHVKQNPMGVGGNNAYGRANLPSEMDGCCF